MLSVPVVTSLNFELPQISSFLCGFNGGWRIKRKSSKSLVRFDVRARRLCPQISLCFIVSYGPMLDLLKRWLSFIVVWLLLVAAPTSYSFFRIHLHHPVATQTILIKLRTTVVHFVFLSLVKASIRARSVFWSVTKGGLTVHLTR